MKKIIIIGAGIAGLSAGIYGRLAGYDVDIYEKNSTAGGECTGWNRQGYHIDNCIHWLTGTKKGSALRQVWETVGALEADTAIIQTEAFYTSSVGDQKATLWNDLDRTEQELLTLSPPDATEIKKFIQHVKYAQCCQVPSHKPLDMMGIGDYIAMGKSMADMPKVMKAYGHINLRDLSLRFQSPVLRKLFCDYLPPEYIASSFLVSYATITSGNGGIPAGGSYAMACRIAQKFLVLGGKLYCNSPVERILIDQKKACGVALANGEIQRADHVISAVNTHVLFEKLIGRDYMDKRWRQAYDHPQRFPLSSGLQAAFAINTEQYPEKDTVFFDCKPFRIGSHTIDRMSVKSFEYEPGFAPAGKTVLQANIVQFDSDYLYWESLSRQAYQQLKAQLSAEIAERISVQFPTLAGQLELLDCWTPLTYQRYCGAYHGAYMSFITGKNEKAFRVKGTVKGLDRLYIASQWISAPGGLPIAVTSGKFAILRILKKDKRPFADI